MILTFAFYKAKYGNWQDKLIAFFTRSQYSHVECIMPNGISWSASPRDGGVRGKNITYKPDRWIFLECELSSIEINNLQRFFSHRKGLPYDWVNIYLHPLRWNSDEGYTCTELLSEGISAHTRILEHTRHCITPQELFNSVIDYLCHKK